MRGERSEPTPNVDVDGIQVRAEEKDRMEFGDPTPVAPPVGMSRGLTMAERIQQMVRREVSMRAEALGMETFEEANDFDVPDDPADPSTPYEEQFDPVEKAAQERLRQEEYLDRVNERHKQMRRVKYPDEVENGDANADERGSPAPDPGSGKSGKVNADKRPKEPSVQGGRSKAGQSDQSTEE